MESICTKFFREGNVPFCEQIQGAFRQKLAFGCFYLQSLLKGNWKWKDLSESTFRQPLSDCGCQFELMLWCWFCQMCQAFWFLRLIIKKHVLRYSLLVLYNFPAGLNCEQLSWESAVFPTVGPVFQALHMKDKYICIKRTDFCGIFIYIYESL